MAGAMQGALQAHLSSPSLLVVDSDSWARQTYRDVAQTLGLSMSLADSPARALVQFASQPADYVLLVVRPSQPEIPELAARMKRLNTRTEVITWGPGLSGSTNGDASGRHQALLSILQHALKRQRNFKNTVAPGEMPSAVLVGQSAELVKLRSIISKLASSRQHLLIAGEAGTGKEQLARVIHANASPDEPFYVVDCASPVTSSLERELLSLNTGCGTIFLDRISELPVSLQYKLVRALAERDMATDKGSSRLSARLIASTSRDLETAVRQGVFRRDLFVRLNSVMLRLPSLRDRREDIPLLVTQVLAEIAAESNSPECSVSPEALDVLMAYSWPGNVTELRSCLRRAAAVSSGSVLRARDLNPYLQHMPHSSSATGPNGNPIVPLAEVEKQTILNALQVLNGDKMATARSLGIGKTTLYRKLRDYGIAEAWITRVPPR